MSSAPWRLSRTMRRVLMVCIAAAAGFLVVGTYAQHRERKALPPPAFRSASQTDAAHVYGNPSVSIARVDVRAVYFVARRAGEDTLGSRSVAAGVAAFGETTSYLTETLFPEIEAFHAREFGRMSEIRFRLYPKAVVGRKTREFYERRFLDKDAADPLREIEAEVTERLLSEDGDLYDAVFARQQERAYSILLIIYAAPIPSMSVFGSPADVLGLANDTGTTALVFRPIVDPQLRSIFPNAASVIEHELLHAMGVPEKYDVAQRNVFAQQAARGDIMGIGVTKQLEETFIGNDVKEGMGVR